MACINPSEKGEGLVRAGIILCRKGQVETDETES